MNYSIVIRNGAAFGLQCTLRLQVIFAGFMDSLSLVQVIIMALMWWISGFVNATAERAEGRARCIEGCQSDWRCTKQIVKDVCSLLFSQDVLATSISLQCVHHHFTFMRAVVIMLSTVLSLLCLSWLINLGLISKLWCICSKVVRLSIAQVLTVISQTQKATLREAYSKKKYMPLDLRPKKTRAIRRRLTKHQVFFLDYYLRSFCNFCDGYSPDCSSYKKFRMLYECVTYCIWIVCIFVLVHLLYRLQWRPRSKRRRKLTSPWGSLQSRLRCKDILSRGIFGLASSLLIQKWDIWRFHLVMHICVYFGMTWVFISDSDPDWRKFSLLKTNRWMCFRNICF